MATVHRLHANPAGPSLAEAIAGHLATLDHPETTGTRRVYAGTLTALRAELGADRLIADLADPAAATQLTAWLRPRPSLAGRHRRRQRLSAHFDNNQVSH
jgi:integrase/recombinase XerC/integrase/recombinase XerD